MEAFRQPGRILILRGGALGDFIVTLPALRLLRERWPAARLELVGHAAAAALARSDAGRGPLDAAYSQNEARWSRLHLDAPPPPELAAFLRGFDLVVNYWPDPEGTLARHFARLGLPVVSGSAAVTSAPAARHFCEPLRALGLETEDFRSRVLPNSEDRGAADALSPGPESVPCVIVHPGSGSPRKTWPVERWAELCRRIDRERPVRFCFVSGETETEAAGTLAALPLSLPARRARALPLPVLAAVLERGALHLGHDTGVSHLAAAVGTPSLLLFGPTDPAVWAPPGEHVQVIRGDGSSMERLPVSTVWESVRKNSFSILNRHGLADQIGPA